MATYDGGQVVRFAKQSEVLEVLHDGEDLPVGIAVDGTHVYWASQAPDGSLRRAPLAGGPAETLYTGFLAPWKIVVEDGAVYVADQFAGHVFRIPLNGMPAQQVAHQMGPLGIALDESHIYSADAEGWAITRAPREGGGAAFAIADAEDPIDIVVDEENVYWTEGEGGITAMQSKTGGDPPIVLKSGQRITSAIEQDDTHIYWTESGGGRVMRVAK
ncbi:hypothetical protein [Chondromyces apiculatus]|nr:hypothetical protein [Chondromyces apiculatus]